MARGLQLQALLLKLKLELGRDVSSGQGTQEDTRFKHALKSAQEDLYENNDWEFLSIHRDETLVAGGRYYSFDADLSFESIDLAQVKVDGQWINVCSGIGANEYNLYDSDEDERTSQVYKWDSYESDQFEVWPIPDSNTQTLRFYGTKALSAFDSNTDTADLDSLLIIYKAAISISKDQVELMKFTRKYEDRMHRLRAKQSKGCNFSMGNKPSVPMSNSQRFQYIK